MKIAVIGSGVSSLSSAYYLSKSHEVHLFEADQRLGGHTNTVEVKRDHGTYQVDTGFIIFNDKNYPHFTELMRSFGLERQVAPMSFSVKVEENGLEYNGTSINSLFCQRKNFFSLSFHRMIRDILRFNKEATKYYLEHIHPDANDLITIEEFVKSRGYSEEFIEHYIMPMGAALWSASRLEMRQFPLNFFVRFFHNHRLLSVDDRATWYVLKGGSKSYIPHLSAPYASRIRLNSPVSAVERKDTGVEIIVNGEKFLFDQVVFGTHADDTLKMIKNPTEKEREILGAFKYRPNDVLLHTDTSILPKKKLGWASWNYFVPKTDHGKVAVTYDMNILQSIKSPETFLVSLNKDIMIDPAKVIKKIYYTHPVFDLDAANSQKRWSEVSGVDRLHFCGAYWGNGFHEDGVRSAKHVADSILRQA